MAYATVEDLAQRLRTRVTSENTALLQSCLDAAAQEIDAWADRFEDDPIPATDPLAHEGNLARAVEWYKAADAAFGAIGYTDTGTLRAPRDDFARHAIRLTPLKQRFGLA